MLAHLDPAHDPRVGRATIQEILWMRRLYEVEQKSLREIVAVTGRPRSSVRQHLAQVGVEMRAPYVPLRPCRRISYEEEVRTVGLYESGLSMGQVAAELGVSKNAVWHRLHAAGVEPRTNIEGWALRNTQGRVGPAVDDELVRLYRDERLSLKQAAERAGVTPGTVRRALRRRGVPVRSLADATRIERARRAGRDALAVAIEGEVDGMRVENVLLRPDRSRGLAAVGHERTDGRGAERVRKYVPSAPLALALGSSGRRPKDVAREAGLSPRLLLAWRTGERRLATWCAADKLLVVIDRFWWEVFDPEDGPYGAFSGVRGCDVVAWIAAAEAAVALWEPDEADEPALDDEPVLALAGGG